MSRKGPGKSGLAGNLGGPLPAAQPSEAGVSVKVIEQLAGPGKVEHGFGDESPRDGFAVLVRPAPRPPTGGDMLVNLDQVEDGGEFFLGGGEIGDFGFQDGKEGSLNVGPRL